MVLWMGMSSSPSLGSLWMGPKSNGGGSSLFGPKVVQSGTS